MKAIPFGKIGAEIVDVVLSEIDSTQQSTIKDAWYRHGVLVFRGQKLSDDALLDFSRNFGALDAPPNQGTGRNTPDGYPDILVVSNVKDGKGLPIGALGDGEALWHTDMSYAAIPPDASMLYALEVPPSGGDTCWCNMKEALKSLPGEMRERVKTLNIKHDGTYDSAGYLRKGISPSADPKTSVGTVHPIVIEHPVTGEAALYLGRRRNAYVMGLEVAESEKLLDQLWASVEAAVYRHRWAVGDLVLWDNRVTMHRRDAFDPAARRVMHRTQIKGARAPQRATIK